MCLTASSLRVQQPSVPNADLLADRPVLPSVAQCRSRCYHLLPFLLLRSSRRSPAPFATQLQGSEFVQGVQSGPSPPPGELEMTHRRPQPPQPAQEVEVEEEVRQQRLRKEEAVEEAVAVVVLVAHFRLSRH